MNGDEYLSRFEQVRNYAEKKALFEVAKDLENDDRRLFARKRDSWEVPELDDPHKGLIKVFDDEEDGGRSRFTQRKLFEEERSIPRLFQRSEEEQTIFEEQPITVPTLKDFREQFLQIFAVHGLQFLDWSNVVAAGGSVSACMLPIPEAYDSSAIERRKFYHDVAYGASDIDLFIYGFSDDEANEKLLEIYDALSAASPFDTACFRSTNAVTICSRYPYRHTQVVLRIYSSPYEILAGFDVDACTFLFDGSNVYTTPRGHSALANGYNTIDVTRRSPSYEVRLGKYSARGFEILHPGFRRERIDPNIFDKPWPVLVGLQKLVVLESLRTAESRLQYQTRHQVSSGKAMRLHQRSRDYGQIERMEKANGGSEESNYGTLFLPWGPDFDAKRLMKLMRKKDRTFNSAFFMEGRTYHLHPCFFGTAEEILDDCAPDDPPLPDDIPAAHVRGYVRGSLSWMKDDPGQQQIGSFNPITDTEWEAGAYFLESTSEVFRAVHENDVERLSSLLESLSADWDPFQRDYLGRSPLHLGIQSGSTEAVLCLLNSDAVDPTLRMPDGRSALHLAVEHNRLEVLKALKPAILRMEEVCKEYEKKPQVEKDALRNEGEIPPRDVTFAEALEYKTFNTKLTALHLAVIMGRADLVRVLANDFKSRVSNMVKIGGNGAAFQPFSKTNNYNHWNKNSSSLSVPVLLLVPPPRSESDSTQPDIVDMLLDRGAGKASLLVMDGLNSIFHVMALYGNAPLMKAILIGMEKRGMEKDIVSLLSLVNDDKKLPIMQAILSGCFECVKLIFERLPKLSIDDEMLGRSRVLASNIEEQKRSKSRTRYYFVGNNSLNQVTPEQTLDGLFFACDKLLRLWRTVIDKKLAARIFKQKNFYGGYYYSPNEGFSVSKEDVAGERLNLKKDLFEGMSEEELNEKGYIEQQRTRIDNALEMLKWVLGVGGESLFERKSTLPESFGYVPMDNSRNQWYFGNQDQTEAETFDIIDMVDFLRERILQEKEILLNPDGAEGGANAAEVEGQTAGDPAKAYQKLFQEHSSSGETYDGFLVGAALSNSKFQLFDPSSPNMKSREGEYTIDREIEIADEFHSRVDLLRAILKRQKATEQRSPRRSSTRNFLRLLGGSSNRASVDRMARSLQADSEISLAVKKKVAKAKAEAANNQGFGRFGRARPQIAKAQTTEEITESIRQALFSSFSFFPQRAQGMIFRYGTSNLGVTLYESAQDRMLSIFRAAFVGDLSAVVGLVKETDAFPPLVCVDTLGQSVLSVLAWRAESAAAAIEELLAFLESVYVEQEEEKVGKPLTGRKKQTARIDNLKLLAAENDNEDEKDAVELLFDDELDKDDVGKKARQEQSGVSKALEVPKWKTHIHPTRVLESNCFVPRTEMLKLLPPSWVEQMEQGERRRLERADSIKASLPAFKVNIIAMAVIRNDVELFKVLLRFAKKYSGDLFTKYFKNFFESPLKSLADVIATNLNLSGLAIALQRIEILQALIEEIGAGAAWERIGEAVNVKLDVERINADRFYKGLNVSSLESNQVDELPRSRRRFRRWWRAMNNDSKFPSFPKTWIEVAVQADADDVFEWLKDAFDSIVDMFDSFLAKTDFYPALVLKDFAERCLQDLNESGNSNEDGSTFPSFAPLEFVPNLKEFATSPASMLACLVCKIGDHPANQFNSAGQSLVALALDNVSENMLLKLNKEGDILDVPCLQIERFARTFSGGYEVLVKTPLHVLASRRNNFFLRVLLREGADVFSPDDSDGSNFLHTYCAGVSTVADGAELLDIFDAINEYVGEDALARLLSEKNHAGLTCFHIIFSWARPDFVEKFFADYLRGDWFTMRNKEFRNLLHQQVVPEKALLLSQKEKIQYILVHLDNIEELLHQENVEGVTPLDQYNMARMDPSVNVIAQNPYRAKWPLPTQEGMMTRRMFGMPFRERFNDGPKESTFMNHPLESFAEKSASFHRTRDVVPFESAQKHVFEKVKMDVESPQTVPLLTRPVKSETSTSKFQYRKMSNSDSDNAWIHNRSRTFDQFFLSHDKGSSLFACNFQLAKPIPPLDETENNRI